MNEATEVTETESKSGSKFFPILFILLLGAGGYYFADRERLNEENCVRLMLDGKALSQHEQIAHRIAYRLGQANFTRYGEFFQLNHENCRLLLDAGRDSLINFRDQLNTIIHGNRETAKLNQRDEDSVSY